LRDQATAGSLFDQLGLTYLGPIDGHDIAALEIALHKARALRTPVVVHCITSKGRGYRAAETHEADRMHAISPPKDPARPAGRGWTDVFAHELLAIGRDRPDVVALTAAMLHPTGLATFAAAYPDRVYDVGIAEQHAVTSAAGLAMTGLHPVVCVYATFLNRAFDQVLMDVALHRLPVTFVLDRAGVTGSDGPSHNGMWDLSLLGIVPGMRVAAPRDGQRLCVLLREAVDHATGPTALRFPKAEVTAEIPAIGRLGCADVLRADPDAAVLIVPVGPLAGAALDAADELAAAGIPVTVADPGWLLPVDPALVQAAGRHQLTLTVEDNGLAGGFGDAFTRAVCASGVSARVHPLGLNQEFLEHGGRRQLLAEQGLDGPGIAAAARAALGVPIRS
jgi:1-deoxy-D-xylulose-5-phosphate synthase